MRYLVRAGHMIGRERGRRGVSDLLSSRIHFDVALRDTEAHPAHVLLEGFTPIGPPPLLLA